MKQLLRSLSQPVIFDASVLMVGVDRQSADENYSFDRMKRIYLDALIDNFQQIFIHDEVWGELDQQRLQYLTPFVGRNITRVSEGTMYGSDPLYTTIFNEIAQYDLFQYRRGQKHNKGEVYSLPFAARNNIPYFSARDGSAMRAIYEVGSLHGIELLGFEQLLLLGWINNSDSNEHKKSYQSLYKSECSVAIKAEMIPKTFNQYILKASSDV